jgi:hypothetical protein
VASPEACLEGKIFYILPYREDSLLHLLAEVCLGSVGGVVQVLAAARSQVAGDGGQEDQDVILVVSQLDHDLLKQIILTLRVDKLKHAVNVVAAVRPLADGDESSFLRSNHETSAVKNLDDKDCAAVHPQALQTILNFARVNCAGPIVGHQQQLAAGTCGSKLPGNRFSSLASNDDKVQALGG